jgi:glyoxylase-like metal-dependent hydrolase (beta-lactamase superfamily II)
MELRAALLLHKSASIAAVVSLLAASTVWSQPISGSMEVNWNEGAADCASAPPDPIQVHRYEPQTFILRTSLCRHFEGNFLYLLIGSQRALLVDTGPVADAKEVPVGKTILELLSRRENPGFPLLIVHTHEHRDHWAGDAQFVELPAVQVVSPDLETVRAFFHFDAWPNEIAHIDLGNRQVDVIPTPGHTSADIVLYDERTGLLISGDFLLPGRLTIENTDAYLRSAKRLALFTREHPVRYVLGSHIELDVTGALYDEGSQFHPKERALQLTRDDVLALPAVLEHFNGFYARYPDFVLTHPLHNLWALGTAVGAIALIIAVAVQRHFGRRRRQSVRPP